MGIELISLRWSRCSFCFWWNRTCILCAWCNSSAHSSSNICSLPITSTRLEATCSTSWTFITRLPVSSSKELGRKWPHRQMFSWMGMSENQLYICTDDDISYWFPFTKISITNIFLKKLLYLVFSSPAYPNLLGIDRLLCKCILPRPHKSLQYNELLLAKELLNKNNYQIIDYIVCSRQYILDFAISMNGAAVKHSKLQQF